MSRLDLAKKNLRIRRAAAMGLTLDAFDAYVIEEQQRADEYRRSMYDRGHQFSMIATHARQHQRTFKAFVL